MQAESQLNLVQQSGNQFSSLRGRFETKTKGGKSAVEVVHQLSSTLACLLGFEINLLLRDSAVFLSSLHIVSDWIHRFALFWAGVTFGGSLLAGPAKFQVEDLSMPVALQVGRVQFLWVMYGELFCLGAIFCLFTILAKNYIKTKVPITFSPSLLLVAVAIVIFAVQHLVLMPPLQSRSERIVSGLEVGDSHIHLIYIFAEGGKFLALAIAGGILPRSASRPV